MQPVTAPAVLLAGLERAIHLVGAACDPTFLSSIATAMFVTEPLALRDGDAARHGARLLLLPATVCDAMLEPLSCRGGASITLAPPKGTMPSAPVACFSKSLAALDVAHFGLAAAMPDTQSSCVSSSITIVKRADLFGAMLIAQAIFDSACIAPICRAKSQCSVLLAKPPCKSNIAAVGSRAGRFVFGML